jgi:hypothetical protein
MIVLKAAFNNKEELKDLMTCLQAEGVLWGGDKITDSFLADDKLLKIMSVFQEATIYLNYNHPWSKNMMFSTTLSGLQAINISPSQYRIKS